MMLLELCNGRGCLALRFRSSKRGCDMGEYTPVHLIEQRHRQRSACFMVVLLQRR